jgi:integrative and conjugative element protein (TIGR02256 family)
MNCYSFSRSRILCFSDVSRATFDSYRHQRATEAGGILLGRIYASEVLVELATEPSPADRRGRFFFNRSHSTAQRRINIAWKLSSGEQIYLGEWHSHPEENAAPSGRDREMIVNNLRDATMEIDFLILVILGHRQDWVGIRRQEGLLQVAPLGPEHVPMKAR